MLIFNELQKHVIGSRTDGEEWLKGLQELQSQNARSYDCSVLTM
jgi:hypothetical protein